MITTRAFAIAHNLDVPDAKKKFWPQWSTVVVSKKGTIEDVIQHFDAPTLQSNAEHLKLYPGSAQFTVKAGEMFTTLDEFESKIKEVAAVWDLEANAKNGRTSRARQPGLRAPNSGTVTASLRHRTGVCTESLGKSYECLRSVFR